MRQTRLGLAATIVAGMMFTAASGAHGQTGPLSPTIASLAFLVGNWTSEEGHAERDEARGTFHIEAAAGGKALLRRDHTEVISGRGAPVQSVDQIMLIYPENGHLRGDYFDGTHVIHYQDAQFEPGRSVRFNTSTIAGAPAFRLTYALLSPDRLSVRFEMQPPGQGEFHTIAEGTARREK